jgi:hypothetical protein
MTYFICISLLCMCVQKHLIQLYLRKIAFVLVPVALYEVYG